MQNKGKIFSAQNLYESIWNEPYFYNCNGTVMVHIRKLRVKIEANSQEPVYIKTVWGKGYRFEGEKWEEGVPLSGIVSFAFSGRSGQPVIFCGKQVRDRAADWQVPPEQEYRAEIQWKIYFIDTGLYNSAGDIHKRFMETEWVDE